MYACADGTMRQRLGGGKARLDMRALWKMDRRGGEEEGRQGRIALFVLRLLCEFLLLLCLHRLQEDVLFPEESLTQLLGLVVPRHVRRLVVAVRRGNSRHDLGQRRA